MTDDKTEEIARNLCKIRGIDPDERVSHAADPGPSGYVCDVMLYSPAWTRLVAEIDAYREIGRAVSIAVYHPETAGAEIDD